MSELSRRGFFGRLGAVVAGAVGCVKAEPVTATTLGSWDYRHPVPTIAVDRESGISVRYVRQYDILQADQWPTRVYLMRPELACRVESAS